MGTLFIAPGSSTDGNYQLQSGVASNYPGLGGGDRGAFGGSIPANRYTLSGLANIPVIYDVYTTGTVVSGTLPIIIKGKNYKIIYVYLKQIEMKRIIYLFAFMCLTFTVTVAQNVIQAEYFLTMETWVTVYVHR